MKKSVERISRVLGLQNPIEAQQIRRNNGLQPAPGDINHETPGLNRMIDLSNRNYGNESFNGRSPDK
jgi:hypothetical protein